MMARAKIEFSASAATKKFGNYFKIL